MSKDSQQFVYMTCRAGAEGAVKEEVARVEPAWRFSFSRPGIVTFKNTGPQPLDDRQLAERNWTFAHAHGVSLGRFTGEELSELAARVWQNESVAAAAAELEFADVHVWQLNVSVDEVQEGGESQAPLCAAIEAALRDTAPDSCAKLRTVPAGPRRASPRNGCVLDIVVLQPGEWIVGYHRAVRRHERWPGGAIPVRLPEHAVSRAYVKMEEALQWSGLPLTAGDECVEVGCAPGGASQALLERGLFVTGIDPAEVDAAVLAHPRFRHLKKRGKDVRRTEFEGVRWLAADMNIAPDDTLDEIEQIVTSPQAAIRGMVLTLKFSDWKLGARVPELEARVRRWGYRDVRTRQLVTGGQEICLVALKRKALRRLGGKLSRKRRGERTRTDAPQKKLSGPHF